MRERNIFKNALSVDFRVQNTKRRTCTAISFDAVRQYLTMTTVLRVTNMQSLRLFIVYVKERFKITTRVRQESCKERLALLAASHTIICDDADENTPVEAK